MARQYLGGDYQGPDGLWHYPFYDPEAGQYGEDLGYDAPGAPSGAPPPTQAPAAAAPAGAAAAPRYPFLGYNQWGGTVAPSTWNPAMPSQGRGEGWGTIGAGTAGIQYGYGVPGFGQAQIGILPDYMKYLETAPGYLSGSGTYNQYPLNKPGLVGTVGGVANSNLRYGQGGTGDPTTGLEAQTPDEWVQGGRLFQNNYPSNWGQDDATRGKDFIANLFLRSDTPSGIGTPAWSAPEQYWQGLAEEIASGRITPTERGWAALQAKGYTPQNIGGAGANRPVGAGGGGAGGAGGQSGVEGAYASIIAMQQAQIAAQVAYQEWQMRTGDETLAMNKAQQAWSQKYQEVSQAYSQKATTAGLTGQWEGQDTMAMQQQRYAQDLANRTFAEQQLQNQNATGLGLLQAQSALQGPRDWAKYWQMSASAPQGLTSALSSLAGRYNFAPGYQGTPGPATLQSRTQDLLSGGQQGAGAPAGAAGAGDGQAGNAWGWNLANWQKMSPSMQQGVLGGAEAGGAYGPDIERLLAQAAPRYTGPGAATVGL